MEQFSYKAYSLQKLKRLKQEKGLTIGLGLPILNEARTLPRVFGVIKSCGSLIDQVVCVDGGSKDKSLDICRRFGAKVIGDAQVARATRVHLARGKGWNMWGALYHLDTDLVLWIDTDISNISPRFITGVIGPLIENEKLQFVKGYYHRPKGDARVTEIMVRPFVNLVFPEVSSFIQPLSGEYGGRRSFLEKLRFYSGYSVEIALLLQVVFNLNHSEYGQSYLGKRIHKLQSIASLGLMSASIMHTLFREAKRVKRLSYSPKEFSNKISQVVAKSGDSFSFNKVAIADKKLPSIMVVKYGKGTGK